VKAQIERNLQGTGPATDPVAAALERLPADVARAWFSAPLIPAAVLIPLITRAEGLSVLLTERTAHLKDHPGQISFPGGRVDAGDVNPLDTALREAWEEIGLPREAVALAGYLPTQPVVTGFAITPVVGFVPPDIEFKPDAFEVADIFEVPLSHFLDPASPICKQREYKGKTVPVFEYHYEERRIWGATANILQEFIKIIKNN
jgi:8-oxo-dGTP pyrophosphatase MutT (NUDIX family)